MVRIGVIMIVLKDIANWACSTYHFAVVKFKSEIRMNWKKEFCLNAGEQGELESLETEDKN